MDRITLDQWLREQLKGADHELKICDGTGRTLGYFLPEDVYRKIVCAWLNAQVTDEELERASQEPGGRTLAEIWASLGQP